MNSRFYAIVGMIAFAVLSACSSMPSKYLRGEQGRVIDGDIRKHCNGNYLHLVVKYGRQTHDIAVPIEGLSVEVGESVNDTRLVMRGKIYSWGTPEATLIVQNYKFKKAWENRLHEAREPQ